MFISFPSIFRKPLIQSATVPSHTNYNSFRYLTQSITGAYTICLADNTAPNTTVLSLLRSTSTPASYKGLASLRSSMTSILVICTPCQPSQSLKQICRRYHATGGSRCRPGHTPRNRPCQRMGYTQQPATQQGQIQRNYHTATSGLHRSRRATANPRTPEGGSDENTGGHLFQYHDIQGTRRFFGLPILTIHVCSPGPQVTWPLCQSSLGSHPRYTCRSPALCIPRLVGIPGC